jgi:hypothetical protein
MAPVLPWRERPIRSWPLYKQHLGKLSLAHTGDYLQPARDAQGELARRTRGRREFFQRIDASVAHRQATKGTKPADRCSARFHHVADAARHRRRGESGRGMSPLGSKPVSPSEQMFSGSLPKADLPPSAGDLDAAQGPARRHGAGRLARYPAGNDFLGVALGNAGLLSARRWTRRRSPG